MSDLWIVIVWFYLAVGCINYISFYFRGDTLWRRGWAEGLVETLFFVLLWPIQVAFTILVAFHEVTGQVLERMFR